MKESILTFLCAVSISITFAQNVNNIDSIQQPPNVVLILADDVALMDFGAYGGEASTPNIDQLAQKGMMFTNFHASPMCGNTICQDRRFLAKWMPDRENYFHYRQIDVSSIKELFRRWNPKILEGLNKKGNHLALDDVRESIEELKYYRQFLGELNS